MVRVQIQLLLEFIEGNRWFALQNERSVKVVDVGLRGVQANQLGELILCLSDVARARRLNRASRQIDKFVIFGRYFWRQKLLAKPCQARRLHDGVSGLSAQREFQ